jgi:CubicO group peptidase (beta-lactamase class C family)
MRSILWVGAIVALGAEVALGGSVLAPLERAARKLQRSSQASSTGCPYIPPAVALPNPSQPPAPIASALQAVEAQLQATLDPVAVPGVAWAVAYRGDVLASGGLGVANKTSGAVPDAGTTPFRIASVSKLFPALSLFLLAQNGTIRSLDDPVRLTLPAFHPPNLWDAGEVSWIQLAQQRSGLQREAPFGANTTAQVVAQLNADGYLVVPPGSRPSYSNLGFSLLGNVLAESVAPSAGGFAGLASTLITGPLGLKNTGFNYSAEVLASLAVGYDATGAVVPFYDLGWSGPAGNAYATALDLTALASLLLQAAQDAPPTPNALRLSPVWARKLLDVDFWNSDGQTLMGAPWETQVVLPYAVRNKGGNLNGYTALFSLVPELQLSLVALWNGGVDEFNVSQALWTPLLAGFSQALTALQPLTPAPTGPAPLDYVGQFLDADAQSLAQVVFNATGQNELIFAVQGFVSVYMSFVQTDLFQVFVPASAFSCLNGELEALDSQFIIFTRNAKGAVDTVAVPGFVPGLTWVKQ